MSIRRTIAASLSVLATITALTVGIATPASAASAFPTLANANLRNAPSTASLIVSVLPKGSPVTVDCYVVAENVNGTAIWNHVSGAPTGWISDSMLLTGSDQPVVPPCQPSKYNRAAAAAWAITDAYIPARYGDADCTWWASNALWFAGLPRTSSWTDASYNPFDLAQFKDGLGSPSRGATVADTFKNVILNAGYGTLTELRIDDLAAGGAQLGDLILYDWDNGADGRIDHVAVVSKIGADGVVGISQHAPARDYRQWNLDGDRNQLHNLRAYLLHITY